MESILQQTYTHFELILINDGSTDSSGQICDHLASQYENIKVYHIENAGVSNARNMGIQLARGSWITFIDSDDLVTQDYLATLASAVEGENVGFVIAPLHHIKKRHCNRPISIFWKNRTLVNRRNHERITDDH